MYKGQTRNKLLELWQGTYSTEKYCFVGAAIRRVVNAGQVAWSDSVEVVFCVLYGLFLIA